ncbi:MAG: hypothetical protein K8R11_07240 [Methanococcoides sp.]|nr:hypothetical protein [Methanococcoides sp.]
MTKKTLEERLQSNTVESLLYIATMQPKTQTDAIELIYNKKNINSSPVKSARDILVREGALKYGEGISKVPLIAQVDVFLNHLKTKSDNRYSSNVVDNGLTKNDLAYLKMVLDSDYFRDIFYSRYFFENCYGVHRGSVVREDGKLAMRGGAFGYMEFALTSILLYSQFLKYSGLFNDLYINDIEEVVSKCRVSNNVVNSFLKDVNPNVYDILLEYPPLKQTMEYCKLEYEPHPYDNIKQKKGCGFENFIDKAVFSGFFLLFPPPLTEKLTLLNLSSAVSTFTGRFLPEVVGYQKEL